MVANKTIEKAQPKKQEKKNKVVCAGAPVNGIANDIGPLLAALEVRACIPAHFLVLLLIGAMGC